MTKKLFVFITLRYKIDNFLAMKYIKKFIHNLLSLKKVGVEMKDCQGKVTRA